MAYARLCGEKPFLNTLSKVALVLMCALAEAAFLFGLILYGAFKMEPGVVLSKLNSSNDLYIFPAVILAELYFFTNDFLAYITQKYQLLVGRAFSEIRFTYDLDNNNTLIPLRAKLWGLYPAAIGLTLGGFILVLLNR
jgi:hypothetical protein